MSGFSRRGFLVSIGMGSFCGASVEGGASTNQVSGEGVKLEHVAFNVSDPAAMADWYCANLGMKIVRQGPPPANMRFISDAAGRRLLELYCNPPEEVPDYGAMTPLQMHIAFSVPDVAAMRQKLLDAGGRPEGEVQTNPDGDTLAFVRDPWNVVIQILKRAQPMLD